ncbi:FAD-dependent oxidoreductase [Virgibacillus necropolis]|uniref:FAD-dependent oxidoreductase n=1 Tax=Virgibacillus necropolis TaxID=163877 RepID=A0A221MGN0_9BACI|nr:FAD-dependent oxidoreductase [Virgibacillus necropolis]ASN06806.1 FAD-dependent oxidoreductase [Virgibacillus necropolis]
MSTKKALQKAPSSFWRNTEKLPQHTCLNKNLNVDVVVAGGGIAGITTAYMLAKKGKKVALVEARKLLSGTTGFTTSKLTAQHALIYDELIGRYGKDTAKKYYQANMEALALVKKFQEEEQIDCELEETDAYVFTESSDWKDRLEKEAQAYEVLEIDGELVENIPLDLDGQSAIVMHKQAQFHPVKYLHGLLKSIENNGGEIYENTAVMDVDDKDGITCQTDQGYSIICENVVFATHSPTYEPDNFYSGHLKPESSYALVVKAEKPFPGGMYINAELPKRTMRGMKYHGENYILVGGESHDTGDGKSSQERYEELVEYADKLFGVKEVVDHWSSHDLFSPDRIPFIGKIFADKDNIYTATGFGKWGLSSATIGAEVITDLILGKFNAYTALFSPARELNETDKEDESETNARNDSNSATKPEDLANGRGAVVEIDGDNVGAYRDTHGKLHILDISCTHMGCGVAWNDGDKTWDCPCHGSRFNATGDVIEGPALEPLGKVENN